MARPFRQAHGRFSSGMQPGSPRRVGCVITNRKRAGQRRRSHPKLIGSRVCGRLWGDAAVAAREVEGIWSCGVRAINPWSGGCVGD